MLPLTFLGSPCSLLLPEPPWVSQGPWDLPGASGSLGSLWKPWVFSQTQRPCFPCSLSPPVTPFCPPCPLSLPRPLWAPGAFLGPQEALGAFTSLRQPLAALGLHSYSGAVLSLIPLNPLTFSNSLSPPEPPWVSMGPWDLPGASGSLGRLCKPLAAFGSLGSSLILRGSAFLDPPQPPHFL